jgi:hypothetical protein
LISRNLDDNDLKLSKYLIYPNDNQNLVNIILEKYQLIPVSEFKSPSIYKSDEILYFLQKGNTLPDYMIQYHAKFKEKFDLLRPARIEEYLWFEFYSEVGTLDNSFIIDYFRFDKILRQLAAIHNSRIFEVSLISELVNDKINRELGLSKPKSILSKSYPFVKELWRALNSQDSIAIEKTMDKIRWNFIDNYDPLANFSSRRVFGFILKLMLSSRWTGLSNEKGKIRFEELSEKAIAASGISELENYDQR